MTDDRRDAPGPQETARPTEEPTEHDVWSKELQEFLVDRFGLVQTAARFWLGTITTLVALFSALIVVNRGESLAALPVGTWGRVGVYVLVVAVYGCAFGAVVRGSQACFGGLSVRIKDEEAPKESAFRRLRAELGYQWSPPDMPMPPELTSEAFSKDRQRRANDARRYLHQSRGLGVVTVGFGILLALVVLALGGFADDPADPTHVVVIQDGSLVCGELDRAPDGRVLVDGQELDDVSQLTAVDGC